MNGIILVGLNYRTAPVEVRERLAFSREGAATALLLFKKQYPDSEIAILSTCNRVEVLVNSDSATIDEEQVIRFLSQVRDVPLDAFAPYVYTFNGEECIRHIFRVISGLDSMVVGEYQIVSQLKQAYELAHQHGTAGTVLHRLFHHAFGVSKRVRSETAIGEGKTSLPSVAVDTIRNALSDFQSKRILIVGAGEMARLTAQYLCDAKATNFVVTTRTLTNAKALAEVCHGQAVPFAELDGQLVAADVVITATNCPTPILTKERLANFQVARAGRPLLLVDLCVPRNIAADVVELPGIVLHDVDALGRIVAENQDLRARQIRNCEGIIEEEVTSFETWVAQSKVRPLIERMFEDVRALANIEVRSFFRSQPDLNEGQREAVEMLADRIVAKLMHPCVSTVRQHSTAPAGAALAEAFHGARLSFDQKTALASANN